MPAGLVALRAALAAHNSVRLPHTSLEARQFEHKAVAVQHLQICPDVRSRPSNWIAPLQAFNDMVSRAREHAAEQAAVEHAVHDAAACIAATATSSACSAAAWELCAAAAQAEAAFAQQAAARLASAIIAAAVKADEERLQVQSGGGACGGAAVATSGAPLPACAASDERTCATDGGTRGGSGACDSYTSSTAPQAAAKTHRGSFGEADLARIEHMHAQLGGMRWPHALPCDAAAGGASSASTRSTSSPESSCSALLHGIREATSLSAREGSPSRVARAGSAVWTTARYRQLWELALQAGCVQELQQQQLRPDQAQARLREAERGSARGLPLEHACAEAAGADGSSLQDCTCDLRCKEGRRSSTEGESGIAAHYPQECSSSGEERSIMAHEEDAAVVTAECSGSA
jgi:hypothetical protein